MAAGPSSPDGSMVTVGDGGYLHGDGYLYLTGRATFMIISGPPRGRRRRGLADTAARPRARRPGPWHLTC